MSKRNLNIPSEKSTRPADKPWSLLPKWLFVRNAVSLGLTAAELGCLIHLVDQYNGKRGYAWPSITKLVELTGYSRITVKRAIAGLVRRGVITKEPGWIGRANRYRIPIYDDPAHMVSPAHTVSPDPDHTVSPDPDHTVSHYPSYLPRSIRVGEEKRPSAEAGVAADAAPPPGVGGGAPPHVDHEAEFAEWWRAYPRKEDRARAKKAFAAVRGDGVSLATLVAAAQQYARAYAHKPERMKWPVTWLQGECWLDDPQPPRPKEPKSARAAKANNGKAPVEPTSPLQNPFPVGTVVWNYCDDVWDSGTITGKAEARADGTLVEVMRDRDGLPFWCNPVEHLQLTPPEGVTRRTRAEWAALKRDLEIRFPEGKKVWKGSQRGEVVWVPDGESIIVELEDGSEWAGGPEELSLTPPDVVMQ
jgi:Helix-turn-helix domain